MAFDAGTILAKIAVDIKQWEKSAKKIKTSQEKIAVQTKKTGMAFKGMWKQVAVGMGVTNLVTSGIRGLIRQMGDTIKVGRSFEKEWANVTTMLSTTRAETEKMRHELRMLSPTLGDTTELAKGMYQVLSASIEPAKAIEFLGEAAKSAKAGVTETRVAVDALTTVINAYGMEAEAVGGISDDMFAIVKRGKLTYDELATSLGTVVPVASTVGVKFKDVGAAVASLTRQGIPAAKATMQLRQVFMAILKPSTEAEEITAELGISMGKNALEAKGLAGWLDELKEKTKGNADIMTKIVPNVRALTAVLALTGKAAEGYAHDQEFMAETMGFTNEAFKKQAESIDFWIETFGVAADKIKVAIYEGLVDSLRESISTAEDFDEKVTQATNNAANNVSLHVSTMVENIGWLGRTFQKTKKFLTLPGFILSLKNGKDATDELAEAQLKLEEALERAGKEAVIEIGAIKSLSEDMLTATERTEIFARKTEVLTFVMNTLQESLELPSEVMARWEEFYNLVETPELDLIWEQQMMNMEKDTLNFMASIIPGMAFMTTTITDSTKKMGEKTKATFLDIASSLGTTLHMIGTKNKAISIAAALINTYVGVSKALSAYAPPLSFAMAALQLAAGLAQVTEIKKQEIPSGEKGAYLPSPAIIEAGHGPMGEVVLPLDRAPAEFFRERGDAMGGGIKIDLNFYAPVVSATGLTDRDMDEAAEYILKKVEDEFERYGGKLNA